MSRQDIVVLWVTSVAVFAVAALFLSVALDRIADAIKEKRGE